MSGSGRDSSDSTLVPIGDMESDHRDITTGHDVNSNITLSASDSPPDDQPPPPKENPNPILPSPRRKRLFSPGGPLRPGRLLLEDISNGMKRYPTDWFFNQLILASAVYLFFTNLLPGITFASDLHVLTKQNYGAIEVVFSTGLCGCIFALWVPGVMGRDSTGAGLMRQLQVFGPAVDDSWCYRAVLYPQRTHICALR